MTITFDNHIHHRVTLEGTHSLLYNPRTPYACPLCRHDQPDTPLMMNPRSMTPRGSKIAPWIELVDKVLQVGFDSSTLIPHPICVMGARSSRASPGVLCSRRSQLSDSIMVQQYIFNSLGTPHYHSNTYDDVYPWPRGLGMGGGGATIAFDSHI